jgi:hypothetical protein
MQVFREGGDMASKHLWAKKNPVELQRLPPPLGITHPRGFGKGDWGTIQYLEKNVGVNFNMEVNASQNCGGEAILNVRSTACVRHWPYPNLQRVEQL